MPELQFYVPNELARAIYLKALRRNITASQYLAELIVDELGVKLPEGFYEDLIGPWNPACDHWLESRETRLLDGVGAVAEDRLRDIGITTLGQLARTEDAEVASALRNRAQRVLSTVHSLKRNPRLAHFTVGQILRELSAEKAGVDEEEFAYLRAQLRFLLLLENRFVLKLALVELWPTVPDSEGFTDFKESADTQKIYVSCSEGDDDRNSGLSEEKPVKTLAAGLALLRDGHPDWLLLRRGDVWEESLGHWVLSGRSEAEPMVISSYGSGSTRPVLATGTNTGLITFGGAGSPNHINHLAFVGLHFHAHTRDPRSAAFTGPSGDAGFRWLRGTYGLLLEDCVFQSYIGGIVVQDFDQLGISNVRIRRCQILDSYSIDSHAQGLYAEGADGLVLEECLFDHNGWNEEVDGAEGTIFNHNVYIQTDCRNVEVYNNIILRGASHGMQLRPGGTVEGNLFVRNAIALLVGGGDEPVPGGIQAKVNTNVILEGTDITPELPRGWGIELKNIRSVVVAENIIAHAITDSPNAFSIHADAEPASVTYENNVVYDWAPGPFDTPGPFTDPDRSVATYNATLGGPGTFEDFITLVRGQSRQRWQQEYTARPIITYIRDGFRNS